MKEGEESVVIWLMNAVVELEVVLKIIIRVCHARGQLMEDCSVWKEVKQGSPPLFLLVMYLF